MAFLVYFFVLLVAGASVMFGLDWTQAPLNPPPYATPPAQTATVTPNPAAKTVSVPVTPAAGSVAVAKTTTNPAAPAPAPVQTSAAAPALDQAAQAQASATPADTTASTTPTVAGSCNVDACSAAYRSFRASDCTYQPNIGDRRLCTKSAAGRVATAAHPRSARRADYRNDDRRYDRRDSTYDRRDAYDDRRGGWGFFGGDDD